MQQVKAAMDRGDEAAALQVLNTVHGVDCNHIIGSAATDGYLKIVKLSLQLGVRLAVVDDTIFDVVASIHLNKMSVSKGGLPVGRRPENLFKVLKLLLHCHPNPAQAMGPYNKEVVYEVALENGDLQFATNILRLAAEEVRREKFLSQTTPVLRSKVRQLAATEDMWIATGGNIPRLRKLMKIAKSQDVRNIQLVCRKPLDLFGSAGQGYILPKELSEKILGFTLPHGVEPKIIFHNLSDAAVLKSTTQPAMLVERLSLQKAEIQGKKKALERWVNAVETAATKRGEDNTKPATKLEIPTDHDFNRFIGVIIGVSIACTAIGLLCNSSSYSYSYGIIRQQLRKFTVDDLLADKIAEQMLELSGGSMFLIGGFLGWRIALNVTLSKARSDGYESSIMEKPTAIGCITGVSIADTMLIFYFSSQYYTATTALMHQIQSISQPLVADLCLVVAVTLAASALIGVCAYLGAIVGQHIGQSHTGMA